MNDSFSKKANDFLKTDRQDLQSVFAKIKELEILNQKLSAYLDPALADYCQVANVLGTRLILLVANSSIATQLRFQSVELIKKFSQDPLLRRIKSVECKVRPSSAPTTHTRPGKYRKMPLLSAESANIVREIAESLDDAKLREVMMKIAEHSAVKPQPK